MMTDPTTHESTDDYAELLQELRQRIQGARLQAALSVNRELVMLYWRIGRDILARQGVEGWGAKTIEHLATDLRRVFPDMTGLSARNLRYMRAFAEAWPDFEIVQQLVAQLPWGHNLRLLDALNTATERKWYAQQAIEQGWSRNVLSHQIGSDLMGRQGVALSNFPRTLPAEQSELAQQLIKDPYSFDFLSLGSDIRERDLERGLVDQLQATLLELGKGFAFVGRQYLLEVGGQDYYLDLLFYHLRLRCFVVVELKIENFKPEYAGKMNFYLSAVDDQLRHQDDKPSIGIILCQGRNEVVVEYALRDTSKPMGVAKYRLSPALPKQLQGDLPTAEDLSREFPAMALLTLRIEIERALRDRESRFDRTSTRHTSLQSVLEELRQRETAPPSTDRLLDAVRVMNQAAHGVDVQADLANQAIVVGRQFLKELEEANGKT